MQYLLIFFCLAIVVYYRVKRESWFNPILFFCSLWLFIISLSTLYIYEINEISQKTYSIAFIGTLCFSIGGAFAVRHRLIVRGTRSLSIYRDETIGEKYTYVLHKQIIVILGIIALLVYLVELFPVLKMYAQGITLQDVRQLYASGSYAYDVGGPAFAVLAQYIAQPFATAIMPLSFISAFVFKEKKKGLLALGFVLVFLQVLIDGGRAIIVQFAFCGIFVFIISRNKEKSRVVLSPRTKRRIRLVVAASIIILLFLSRLRGVDDMYKSLYLYICGCMPYMDIRLGTVDAIGFYSLGASSLFGVTSILRFVLSVVGINPEFFKIVSDVSHVQEVILISNNDIYMNAFVSPFYHLYQDGRWLGVAAGMLIYGYCTMSCYRNMRREGNARNIYLCCLLLVGILFSMVRIPFAKSNYVLAIAFSLLLFKRVRRRQR